MRPANSTLLSLCRASGGSLALYAKPFFSEYMVWSALKSIFSDHRPLTSAGLGVRLSLVASPYSPV